VPAELQIVDGVTGIWYSKKTCGEWGEAKRVVLIEEGISLDGCQWVGDGEIWFCSVRMGNLREIDLWMADIQDGEVSYIRHGGERLNVEVGIGEFHVTANGRDLLPLRASLPSNPTTNLPLMPNDRISPCSKSGV
jgi:hypothetical protein